MKHELARAVWPTGNPSDDDYRLFAKPDLASNASVDDGEGILVVSGCVDFTTYFNALSVGKWQEYAELDAFSIKLSLKGDAATVAITRIYKNESDAICDDVWAVHDIPAADDLTEYEFPLPGDCIIAGFGIQTDGVVEVTSAKYYGVSKLAESTKTPKVALVTTTFKKEDYIVPNIGLVKESLFSDAKWARRLHMFVIDNGQTLDADALSDENVSVIPNINAGGAGGFARGMMEAMDDGSFTHVLLMDDDVKVCPESFKRTWTLLSLAQGKWARACINGAMLVMEKPYLQFEDVAFARKGGGYAKVKPDLDMRQMFNLAVNESFSYDDIEHLYGAWWYSCIPMDAISENGLPMPFFVRCDDVEYGIRMNRPYMTMNGIGIWHAGFDGRFRPAVDCYQYARNMLATMAVHDFFDERLFKLKFHRTFDLLLRKMDYASADLWLDGLDDYLKGPKFLSAADGAQLMQENSGKSEKMQPVAELPDAESLSYDERWLSPNGKAKGWLGKFAETIPHDRHWFPKVLLRSKMGVTAPGIVSFSPWTETAMTSRLAVMSPDGETVYIREIDQEKYRRLWQRYRALTAKWAVHGKPIAAEWRKAYPQLTSQEFWKGYLSVK